MNAEEKENGGNHDNDNNVIYGPFFYKDGANTRCIWSFIKM